MTERLDAVVVGAGAIGLAIARRLALAGRDVVILERADAIGTETSSRNSEVIHAGIYYPTGSLKARLCVAGRSALYSFCAERGVPHRRCGKLIVATTEAETRGLEKLLATARANGVDDLVWLDAGEVRALEPEIACTRALFSPSTGIVDSHGFLLALLGDAEARSAMVAFETPLLAARPRGGGIEIETGGAAPMRALCRSLINVAGLHAPLLSRHIEGVDPASIPAAHYAKGNYFTLAGRTPFRHLIYPMPEPGGLGVHVTLDLAGRARFGPDVEWIAAPDYAVDPARAGRFYAAIRRYWPGLRDDALQPGYAGIRPKLGGPEAPAADFLIQGPAETGLPGYTALYGIESPGLTAALAIADWVAERAA